MSPWVAVAAGLAGAAVVVRLAARPGSAAFLAGRAGVLAAVALALGVAWWRGAIARGGWRAILLPCAAVARYRAGWEARRLVRPEPPLWFLAAGVPLAAWVLVAAARAIVRELRFGFAPAPR